ncbi:MAG: sensor histidine kinase [Myxococcaceae bacterium]
MLHEFIITHREELIARCKAKISSRPVPMPTEAEIEHGVPLFLNQLSESIRLALDPTPALAATAAKHGRELLDRGFSIAQVVHDYGGVCQAITELAVDKDVRMTPKEFQALNLYLDVAIAESVSEYGRLRASESTERLGRLAHELRNFLSSASLSFEVLKSGTVGIGGSTGGVLERSLAGIRGLIDGELAEVRLGAGKHHSESINVHEFIADIEAAATLQANARGIGLSVICDALGATVRADRQILASVVSNLVHNAVKFTRPQGLVRVHTHKNAENVLIDVEDQCGGLSPGTVEKLFKPFQQDGADRTGLGLGLDIAQRGAKASGGVIRVTNHAGAGCMFTLQLPRELRTIRAV